MAEFELTLYRKANGKIEYAVHSSRKFLNVIGISAQG